MATGYSFVIADDHPLFRGALRGGLDENSTIMEFGDFDGVKAFIAEGNDIDLVLLDLSMPDMDGLDVLSHMRTRGLDMPVVVQTARGSIDTAVQAMRAGAFDFVVKPASPERLQAAVASALKFRELKAGASEGAARPAGAKDGQKRPFRGKRRPARGRAAA